MACDEDSGGSGGVDGSFEVARPGKPDGGDGEGSLVGFGFLVPAESAAICLRVEVDVIILRIS